MEIRQPITLNTDPHPEGLNKVNDNLGRLVSYQCTCNYVTAGVAQNFFFTLPSGASGTLPIASLGAPVQTADYNARVFAMITADNKLRIGIKADAVQNYLVNVVFLKDAGALTPTT